MVININSTKENQEGRTNPENTVMESTRVRGRGYSKLLNLNFFLYFGIGIICAVAFNGGVALNKLITIIAAGYFSLNVAMDIDFMEMDPLINWVGSAFVVVLAISASSLTKNAKLLYVIVVIGLFLTSHLIGKFELKGFGSGDMDILAAVAAVLLPLDSEYFQLITLEDIIYKLITIWSYTMIIGGVISITYFGYQIFRGKRTKKDPFPFIPSLYLGMLGCIILL